MRAYKANYNIFQWKVHLENWFQKSVKGHNIQFSTQKRFELRLICA